MGIAEFGKAHQPFARSQQQKEPESENVEGVACGVRNPAFLLAQGDEMPEQSQWPEHGAKIG